MTTAKPITPAGKARFLFYLAALAAGASALAGYAEFDAGACLTGGSCMFDLNPFDVREFVLTLVTTGGNILAAIALWTGAKSR